MTGVHPEHAPAAGKTVTVTDVQGCTVRLDGADLSRATDPDGYLTVVGEYGMGAIWAPGQWVSIVADEHRAPDSTAIALGIARRALNEIMSALRSDSGSPDETLDRVCEITDSALDVIAGETA